MFLVVDKNRETGQIKILDTVDNKIDVLHESKVANLSKLFGIDGVSERGITVSPKASTLRTKVAKGKLIGKLPKGSFILEEPKLLEKIEKGDTNLKGRYDNISIVSEVSQSLEGDISFFVYTYTKNGTTVRRHHGYTRRSQSLEGNGFLIMTKVGDNLVSINTNDIVTDQINVHKAHDDIVYGGLIKNGVRYLEVTDRTDFSRSYKKLTFDEMCYALTETLLGGTERYYSVLTNLEIQPVKVEESTKGEWEKNFA